MKRHVPLISLVIGIAALLAYVPLLGHVDLFDWDEVNFAEAAREMLVTGEWRYVQIGYEPFWEKPPLFIYMQALCMKLFGVNAFAARLPNAIAGAVTLVLLFRIGAGLVNPRFGLLWAGVFAGSLLPGFYFRSGIIDPWFNLFIFLGIHQLAVGSGSFPLKKERILAAGVLIGLAVLTKGPVGLLIPSICAVVFAAWHWGRVRIRWGDPLLFLLPVLAIGFSYFIAETMRGHGHVVREFIDYQLRLASQDEAGHAQPFWYHAAVLIPGCFPASLLFLFSLRRSADDSPNRPYHRWMQVMFWVVLIVFSLVRTKIVHYSSLTYFPLTFLAAWQLERLWSGRWQMSLWQRASLIGLAVLLGLAFILLGMANRLKPMFLPLLEHDIFAHALLSRTVAEHPMEPLIGLLFILGSVSGVVMMARGRLRTGIPLLLGTAGITVWLLGVVIAPKVEQHTQRDVIDFYREKSTEHCYLQPLHFRTYAHLFYGEAMPDVHPRSREVNWLALESTDRPVYFIIRKGDEHKVHRWFTHIQVVEERGAWLIMQREDAP